VGEKAGERVVEAGHKAEEGIKALGQRAGEGVKKAAREVRDGVVRVGEKVEEKKEEARKLDEGDNGPALMSRKKGEVWIEDPPRLGGLIGGRGPIASN